MMVPGICERLSAKSCRSCRWWSRVSVNVFPLSHVDHVDDGHVNVLMVPDICERLSAKSCRSCRWWSRVSVNVFPLSHVDHVDDGPGYHVDHVMYLNVFPMMVPGICERLSAKSCRSCRWWSRVSVNVFPLSHVDLSCRWWSRSVNVFPLTHVDHADDGPGYLWTSFR